MNKTFLKHLFSDKNFIITLLLLIIFSSAFAQLVPYFQGLIVDDVLITLDMNFACNPLHFNFFSCLF